MTATIVYTSARRHKPDVVGAELAPSMVSTNWTAGNGATLSNDTDDNLKVAYNATANPFAYRAITVTANSVYRIKVSSISDGTAQLPVVAIGTSNGGRELGEYDFRNITATDADGAVEIPVVAPGTTIYLSLYCAIGSAGYALFDDASVKLVTTLTHSTISFANDDIALGTNAYTANNSSLARADVCAKTNSRDDNALSVTNSGAVNGEARRTNPFPTVSGRQYKVSVAWVPHSVGSGTVNVGTALGGSQLGGSTKYADIDNSASFFTPGSGLRWNFTNTDDGWTITNGTKANGATAISLTATSTDPQFKKSGLSFSGQTNRYVAAYVKRTSVSWSNDSELYYTTASHGESASYRGAAAVATLVQNEYTVLVYDMWNLVDGGNDWKNSTITGLRIDFTNTNGATWDVDWIAVGNLNQIEHTFTATGASTFFTLVNSSQSNAISYYVLPHVDQLDSEYTLTPGIYRAEQSYPETVQSQLSLDGTEERIFHREEEIWNVTTKVIDGTDALADYLEFLSSVKSGETFTIDLYGDSNTKTAKFISGSQNVERVDSTKYRVSFGYRVQT